MGILHRTLEQSETDFFQCRILFGKMANLDTPSTTRAFAKHHGDFRFTP